MEKFYYFYSFQVLTFDAHPQTLSFGSGDIESQQPLTYEEMTVLLKRQIDAERKQQKIDAIEWDLSGLHILAFNALPR